ncbi:hypothetical protein BIV57_22660 [Mangrovactinospora gilvigrisea]|uniref:DUF1453 domain-containing protein n=1 Tax=Mangrovactinospora gilvigrisea TaxID=1428644 RepID=A0A1J7C0Y0_9ACTN|nr:hypothetical protein [Mangrovactinospora gilvigrisea]OIV35236.1 hypothetical protein BIV57_22660 [Mangrovactinospora gilvigrisea]
MSGSLTPALIAGVVVLMIVRQFAPQRAGGGRRVWVLPIILAVVAFTSGGGLIDHHHAGASMALEGVGLAVSLIGGILWGATARVWIGSDGAAWSRASVLSLVVWLGALAARIAVFALGHAMHVSLPTGAITLSFAVMLLARGAVVAFRMNALAPSSAPHAAFGAGIR